ncbi:MAG: hypothetical protein HYZ75_06720 [Elusimicrobia bacterium]|nr:hypothetical protein [Elusimicrobiota bacterium]
MPEPEPAGRPEPSPARAAGLPIPGPRPEPSRTVGLAAAAAVLVALGSLGHFIASRERAVAPSGAEPPPAEVSAPSEPSSEEELLQILKPASPEEARLVPLILTREERPAATAEPAAGAVPRAPAGPKPRLRRVGSIMSVAKLEGGERGDFRGMSLVRDANPKTGAWIQAVDSARCSNCSDAATSHDSAPVQGSFPAMASKRYIGVCADGTYAYSIVNTSKGRLRTKLTSASGEAWDLDLPPGGAKVIKSRQLLSGPLKGRLE